ncbi:A1pp-domain-containing protein [Trichocladium antarcticum]|uniref:A1pp-domain-containing protein n=1 Tax=Trichocladium antarcticum TaxID=1450529 RepID=A0AAN6ZAW7_9PEZI|nr:A1pp-domain-containing protein [Trichocladium antarcticum]
MTILSAADIPSIALLYKLRKLPPTPPAHPLPTTHTPPTPAPRPSSTLNARLAVLRGDITHLAVDAVVNAANRSLLGGGGVDGAIHRAAGPQLQRACRALGGCATGSAKMTAAYGLPCRHVIHAVGPVYELGDGPRSAALLAGCYARSLALAAGAGCRSVAFSAISTGVYGFPSREAAPVALGAIRRFLEGPEGEGIDKVVIVTFEMKDVDAYNEFIPLYFPPVLEEETTAPTAETDRAKRETDAQLEAEAEAVANELPSAPTSDPSDAGRAGKKQKHDGA